MLSPSTMAIIGGIALCGAIGGAVSGIKSDGFVRDGANKQQQLVGSKINRATGGPEVEEAEKTRTGVM